MHIVTQYNTVQSYGCIVRGCGSEAGLVVRRRNVLSAAEQGAAKGSCLH